MNKDIYSLLNNTENQDALSGTPLSDTEVNDIMKKFRERNNVKKSGGLNKRFILAFAAAAAAVTIVPTSVYAYSRYKAEISKTAKYQNTVVIEATDTDSDSAADSTDSSNSGVYRYDWDAPLMKYEFGWLPDGYEKPENNWHYTNGIESIAPSFYRLPDNKGTKIDLPWSADCETYKSDGKTAMINYRISYQNGEEGNYGRAVWVSFDDTSYLLAMSVTDGISREELLKIIDNLKLTQTDEVCFSTYLPWEDKADSGKHENPRNEVDLEKCEIYHTGDTISYNHCLYDDDSYDITLNSVEITDSLDGINTDACGKDADYSGIMDENGNIAENIRSWVRLGDGVNSIDEVVREESVPMHILKLNVTCTNTSEKEYEYIVNPRLMTFTDGEPDIFFYSHSSDGLEAEDSIRQKMDIGKAFSFDSDKKGGKNYVVLKPGESAEVELAFFVADDETEGLFTYFMMSGNNLSSALEHGNCPIFDLGQ